jgi:TolA-binding protein
MKSNLVLVFGITLALSASTPQSNEPYADETDRLLAESNSRMQELTVVSDKVDHMVKEKVVEMREQIETLEEQNEVLVQEKEELVEMVETVTQQYHEEIIKRDSAPTKQFDVLAILPDSTNRR